jgi:hypothetical protein
MLGSRPAIANWPGGLFRSPSNQSGGCFAEAPIGANAGGDPGAGLRRMRLALQDRIGAIKRLDQDAGLGGI